MNCSDLHIPKADGASNFLERFYVERGKSMKNFAPVLREEYETAKFRHKKRLKKDNRSNQSLLISLQRLIEI